MQTVLNRAIALTQLSVCMIRVSHNMRQKLVLVDVMYSWKHEWVAPLVAQNSQMGKNGWTLSSPSLTGPLQRVTTKDESCTW